MTNQTLKNFFTRIAVNLQARKMTMESSQKGASALEYIVLAAVLVGILTIAMTNDSIQSQVTSAFADLFTDATTAGD